MLARTSRQSQSQPTKSRLDFLDGHHIIGRTMMYCRNHNIYTEFTIYQVVDSEATIRICRKCAAEATEDLLKD